MPLYEFNCPACGSFEELRPFSEANNPMPCPTCRTVATRVPTAPSFPKTPPGLAAARNREEQSAHEPRVVRRQVGKAAEPHLHQSHGRPWQIGH
jgi:putative FmdB family regulatory protein